MIEQALAICECYWKAHQSLFVCFELVRDKRCSKSSIFECNHCDNEDCCVSQEELRCLYNDLAKKNILIFDLERTILYKFPLTSDKFLLKVHRYLERDLELW